MSKKLKKRWIGLDADPLIFQCTEAKAHTNRDMPDEGTSLAKKYKAPLAPFKVKLQKLINDIENEIAASMPGEVKGIKVFFSDPKTNFRFDLYPEYKSNRDAGSRSKMFYRLRKWALKEFGYIKGIEADDAVAYYVREKNYIGAAEDKDLWRGVPGLWFHTHYTRRYLLENSPGEANCFNLIQTLTGDPDDYIKALPDKKGYGMIPMDPLPEGMSRQPFKVSEKKAIDLLDEFGWDWNGVVKAYESKGFTEKDAIFTRRLISMDQWHPKKGVKLWKPKKKK